MNAPRYFEALLAALLLATTHASAQGPHEIALLINQNSPDSIEIAHHYAHQRRIPPSNLIYLDLPDSVRGVRSEISLSDFQHLILEPVQKTIETRRLQDHILAWVYSADFPIRITTDSPMSLTGATFTRGEFPPREQVDKGLYVSPFFRGPLKPDETSLPAGSLQEFAVILKEKMPIPAMMLGYTGARGLSAETIVDDLRRAAAADGTQPRDPVYFHISDDVRSQARRWQLDAAAAELKQIGLPSEISSNRPPAGLALSGLMLGTAFTADPWGRLQPGALADNLTSFGAYFHTHEQTRISYWLSQGAAASAGTVTEPLAIWTKFPNARLFAHYANGCTALESYMQSVRSPIQLLLVGDPLCKPWSRAIPLTLISMDDAKKPLHDTASFLASTLMARPGMSYLFLLNGRALPAGGSNPGLRIDTQILNDGYHELTAVVYSPGPIRKQGYAQLGFTVDNHGQYARLSVAAGTNATLDVSHPFNVTVSAAAGATNLVISVNERGLWQGAVSTQEQTVALSAAQIGPGPALLQATAYFPDNKQVRSKPVPIAIRRLNQAPTFPTIVATNLVDGSTQFTARSTDPDGDAVRITWFADLLATDIARGQPGNALQRDNDGAWTLAATGGSIVATLPAPLVESARELTVALRIAPYPNDSGQQLGGLVFDFKDDQNYACFGWHWEEGGWILGRVENGRLTRFVTRGMPLDPRHTYTIGLSQDGDTLTASVNDEPIGHTDQLRLRGTIGLCGGVPSLTISRLGLSPPTGWNTALATNTTATASRAPMLIRASDQAVSVWTTYP